MERFDLESCGSTNAEASAWALANRSGSALFTAVTQTSGRGQWGREWLSPAGGAWFSLVLRRSRVDELVALEAARAVRDALSGWVSADRLVIKPPNDVLLDDRKVAGVLCEQSVLGGGAMGASESAVGAVGATVVVGVGVNVDLETSTLGAGLRRPAISLREATGARVSVASVIDGCVSALRSRLGEGA